MSANLGLKSFDLAGIDAASLERAHGEALHFDAYFRALVRVGLSPEIAARWTNDDMDFIEEVYEREPAEGLDAGSDE